jgi:hypothetical protein
MLRSSLCISKLENMTVRPRVAILRAMETASDIQQVAGIEPADHAIQ